MCSVSVNFLICSLMALRGLRVGSTILSFCFQVSKAGQRGRTEEG